MQYEEKKYCVRQFYMDLSHVVNLAREVLDTDIVKEYDIWCKSKIHDPYKTDENTYIALGIEHKVQDDLYKKGYKDTNRSESLPFPIECYMSEWTGAICE